MRYGDLDDNGEAGERDWEDPETVLKAIKHCGEESGFFITVFVTSTLPFENIVMLQIIMAKINLKKHFHGNIGKFVIT